MPADDVHSGVLVIAQAARTKHGGNCRARAILPLALSEVRIKHHVWNQAEPLGKDQRIASQDSIAHAVSDHDVSGTGHAGTAATDKHAATHRIANLLGNA